MNSIGLVAYQGSSVGCYTGNSGYSSDMLYKHSNGERASPANLNPDCHSLERC